mgnify:CR=1 FL=1
MVYFIADPHYKHDAEFVYKRCGCNSIDEYDEYLLDGINYYVKEDDTLYILGDVAWMNPFEFLKKIKCKHIFVVKGNHDKELYAQNNKNLIPKKVTLLETLVDINIKYEEENYPITLCHYPMVSWNKSHYGSWLIYGHVHHNVFPFTGKMIDVAPCTGHIYPYSFSEIKAVMETLPNAWDFIDKNTAWGYKETT